MVILNIVVEMISTTSSSPPTVPNPIVVIFVVCAGGTVFSGAVGGISLMSKIGCFDEVIE